MAKIHITDDGIEVDGVKIPNVEKLLIGITAERKNNFMSLKIIDIEEVDINVSAEIEVKNNLV